MYLSSLVTENGKCTMDIKRCIGFACATNSLPRKTRFASFSSQLFKSWRVIFETQCI